MKLEEIFLKFLKEQHVQKPLLLALSGGVDSRVLFELLVYQSRQQPLSFSVAHVDHGWRSESSSEAKLLESLCSQHGIAFYLKKLDPSESSRGNSEDICRNLRLGFFKELCAKHQFQAVLTGHHADDVAETVLKRLFESGSISSLGGMQSVTYLEGLTIWRPLLTLRKSEILAWALSRNVQFYEDYTNFDTKYLRAKFRKLTLPYLNETFGKDIIPSLCSLSKESFLLRDYFTQKLLYLIPQEPNTALGWYLRRGTFEKLHLLEQRFLLQELTKMNNQVLSKAQNTQIIEAFCANKSGLSFPVGRWGWFLERAGLFFLPCRYSASDGSDVSLSGVTKQRLANGWSIEIEKVIHLPLKTASSWEDLLGGKGEVYLPEQEDYFLSFQIEKRKFPGQSSIGKWWSSQHIPLCLRQWPPLIIHSERVVHEFLTGRSIFELTKYKRWVKITIRAPDTALLR